MEVGAIGFLEKPCCLESLRESIARAIELARQRRQAIAQDLAKQDRLASLTSDERVALQMIASGKPDKAIAAGLEISIRTVQYRRAALMKKLNVKSRAALIRIAPFEASVQPVLV